MSNGPATSLPILLLNSSVLTSTGLYRLSEITVEGARAMVKEHAFQSAIVFRLNRRLPEGAVLTTLAEIEAVGFSFSLLERLE